MSKTKKPSKNSQLPKKYPVLFKCRHMDGTIHSFQSISAGDGWFNILEAFAKQATPIIKKYSKEDRPYLSTIKEKYGTLRIYLTHEPKELSELVQQAEDRSEITCETCGEPGQARGKGWIYTACERHTKEIDK